MLFEELDALIEQNRKGHYLVDAPRALATRVRLDDGSLRDVAGVRNEAGNVLGLMPHPEHAVDPLTGSTDGLAVFAAVAASGRGAFASHGLTKAPRR